MRRLQIDLPDDLTSPRRARRAVQHLLRGDGDRYLADALLLTSELVTNAVVHASGGCTLNGSFDPGRDVLTVEVKDRSAAIPTLGPSGRARDIGGRGLRIVDRIARRWGTARTPTGKTIWFEVGERGHGVRRHVNG